MRLAVLCALIAGLLPAQNLPLPGDWQGWLALGMDAQKRGQYAEAAEDFQRVLDYNPSYLTARLYLGSAYVGMYAPSQPQTVSYAQRAQGEFQRVLEGDPANVEAIRSLAALEYAQAQSAQDKGESAQHLRAAEEWYRKLAEVAPGDREAHYGLGVIAWSRMYPDFAAARGQAGMRPADPGPLPNSVRLDLKTKTAQQIEDGIASLRKALSIDPVYSDAMAYLNLMLRLRADLADTPDDSRAALAEADALARRAFETKGQIAAGRSSMLPPAPPPPSPPGGAAVVGANPARIRVGANVQAANLLVKVPPEYPPLALQARIQGTVRFTAIIDKQGHVTDAQLVSGHPLLVSSAQQAVQRWVYKPVLLNGNPVEVVTQIDVSFTLEPALIQ